MKKLTLIVLLVAVSAYADGEKDVKYNIIRPYQEAPVEAPAESKKDNLEGATSINEQEEDDKKHKPMRLHVLSKRPYAVKNKD